MTYQHELCMPLTEKTSCVSASMLMVLRFNCTANRCEANAGLTKDPQGQGGEIAVGHTKTVKRGAFFLPTF